MNIKVLSQKFSVSKIDEIGDLKLHEFSFLSVTDEEISLVCPTEELPDNVTDVEHLWRAMKIEGIMEFSMLGVISKISTLFAENSISIFVISTYNTDYILIKEDKLKKAIKLLRENGYNMT